MVTFKVQVLWPNEPDRPASTPTGASAAWKDCAYSQAKKNHYGARRFRHALNLERVIVYEIGRQEGIADAKIVGAWGGDIEGGAVQTPGGAGRNGVHYPYGRVSESEGEFPAGKSLRPDRRYCDRPIRRCCIANDAVIPGSGE